MTGIASQKITLGISSCLLGQEVRFDSSHKHNRYITSTLGEYFDFRPFCPEVAIGLGIPRPPVRLVQVDGAIRVRGVRDPDRDVTDDLRAYAQEAGPQCADISGYIFKSKSPSCGMERVKIYSKEGQPVDSTSGVFAAGIMQQYPSLPVEEEGRLMDPHLRENFIERVFIYHRWQQYLAEGLSPGALVDFHTRHKYVVLAHHEPSYQRLGRLVADAGNRDLQKTLDSYIAILMQALRMIATNRKHTNVLQHIMGYFKAQLGKGDKEELLDVIEEYRCERLPLIVPITLIKHWLRIYPNKYIASQYYLNPHPRELKLRNQI
ncbi:MAG: DUF1722 domain-containing protein [Gammaproteobacteria bacterium]|nr:MAG: DUF1722 domain-containing protein [Gammaproteobacteria bacterium]